EMDVGNSIRTEEGDLPPDQNLVVRRNGPHAFPPSATPAPAGRKSDRSSSSNQRWPLTSTADVQCIGPLSSSVRKTVTPWTPRTVAVPVAPGWSGSGETGRETVPS